MSPSPFCHTRNGWSNRVSWHAWQFFWPFSPCPCKAVLEQTCMNETIFSVLTKDRCQSTIFQPSYVFNPYVFMSTWRLESIPRSLGCRLGMTGVRCPRSSPLETPPRTAFGLRCKTLRDRGTSPVKKSIYSFEKLSSMIVI